MNASFIVQHLLEDDFEADLKRYVNDIYRSSNLGNAELKQWMKSICLQTDLVGDYDLYGYWNHVRLPIHLIIIAFKANVQRNKLVLAVLSCARLALNLAPSNDTWTKPVIEASKRYIAGNSSDYELLRLVNIAAHATESACTFAAVHAAEALLQPRNIKEWLVSSLSEAIEAGVSESDLADAIRAAISPVELKPVLLR